MGRVTVQESVKPTELVPQQASVSTFPSFNLSIEQIQGVCQEFLGEFQVEIDGICLAAYEAVRAKQERTVQELSVHQENLRQAEAELESLQKEASEINQFANKALAAIRTQADTAAAPLVKMGVLEAKEIEPRIWVGLIGLQAKLDQVQQDSVLRLKDTREREAELRMLVDQYSSTVSSLDARLAELQQLPAVVSHLAAVEEAHRKEAEQMEKAIRFLRVDSWGEFSRNRKATPKLVQIEALSRQNADVFDALVERLSTELSRINSVPPTIAWSVIRIIEEFGFQDVFPDLPTLRTKLALTARLHKHEQARKQEAISTKVVSLASHWGAKLAAS